LDEREVAVSEMNEDTGENLGVAEGPAESSDLRWYVVHTYSGHEARARASLLERIRAAGLEGLFGEVLIPTESVLEMRKGQKRTTTRKFYPGYMFVQMKLTKDTWHLVKGTPKITGFLGGTNPSPVPEREILQVKRQETEGAAKPKPKVLFEEGENVRVTDGPFSNFAGIVEEVKPEKQKVRVLVSIFGRATPVELDFTQVEKS
jgi:transcriptional antiterminator NusG